MKVDVLVVVTLVVAALVLAGGPADALRSRRRHRQGLTRHRRFGSVEFRFAAPILSTYIYSAFLASFSPVVRPP